MKQFEIRLLSEKFRKDHPEDLYPEFERKNERPYVVMLFRVESKMFAIPFRTNMNHKYGYRFKNSDRKTNVGTGLDFTKCVLIDDPEYIGEPATINGAEYAELREKFFFIRSRFIKYYNGYADYLSGNIDEYRKKAYRYSTLKYYDPD